MKKLMMVLTLMIIFSLISPLVLSADIEIENCESNGKDWECEIDEVCVCEIEGECTDGVLLVYDDDVTEMLCIPEIDDNEAEFTLDSCGSPGDEVKVRADCDEGQSDEEEIEVIEYVTYTTIIEETTTTREITTTRATTTEELEPCPIDWECCEGELYYEDEPCPPEEECIDHECVPYEEKPPSIDYTLIAGIIVVIIVVFLIYTFFIKKRGKMTFKKLYEKWT